jgi:hypothetical protein
MANRERAALSAHARRGRTGRAWTEYRRLLLARYGPTCQGMGGCGGPITVFHGRTREAYTIGHATPLSKGGPPFDIERDRPQHYGCNAAQGARTLQVLDTSREW